jgi:hypothetical protein
MRVSGRKGEKMSRDYHYQKPVGTRHGYPTDQWGHILSKEEGRDGMHVELTNPYGALWYAIGNGDDFVCFDYATLRECGDGQIRLALHATVNSDTASFIEGFGYFVETPENAPAVALGMTDQALEWAAEPAYDMWTKKYTNVRHSKRGWNQDPYYFYRSVYITCAEILGKTVPDFSQRQYRMGGKRIDRFVGLAA